MSESLVRKFSHDFVQRLRIALPEKLSILDKETVELVSEEMCKHLGIAYLPPQDVPRRKSDGRAAPWARKKGK